MRITLSVPVNWQLLALASLSQLGYPDASTGALCGTQWFLQQAANGLSYCVCIGSRHTSTATLLAATVTSTTDSADPVQLARDRVATALAAGYDAMLEPHINWWNAFWQQSSVSVPELP